MIIRNIRVEGWRCFADPIEVGPFGEGLNVVHGPNGSGKTTLFLAMVRCLFDKHSSRAADIKTLRPTGRELSPAVLLEFEHDGIEYQLRKQFLVSARAELRRKEQGHFTAVADGDAAETRARGMLGGEERRGGLSEPRNWGLAQLLWAPQGRLDLKELSGAARQMIEQSLGAQVADAATGRVEQQVAERYAEYFTPGGKLREGKGASALVGLNEQLAEVKQRRDRLSQEVQAFDVAADRIEQLRSEGDQLEQSLTAVEGDLQKATARSTEYQRIASERGRLKLEIESISHKHAALDARIETIRKAAEDIKRCAATLDLLGEEGPVIANELQARSAAVEAKQAKCDEIRSGGRGEVERAKRLAADATRFVHLSEQLALLESRLQQAREASQELESLARKRSRILAPTAKQLQAIQRAVRDRDECGARLEASLISLELTAEADLTIKTLRAEQAVDGALPAGNVVRISGAPEVAVAIAGVGVLRASGPVASVDDVRRQHAQASTKVAELTGEFNTNDLDELQQRTQLAAELDQQIARLRERIDALLDRRSLEERQEQVSSLQVQIEELAGKYPQWREQPPAADELSGAADARLRAFEGDIDAAEADLKHATAEQAAAGKKLELHHEKLKHAQQDRKAAEQRIEHARDDGQTDDQRIQSAKDLMLQYRAATESLGAVEAQLREFGGDPRHEIEVLNKQLQALQKEQRKAHDQLSHERGRLQTILDSSPYTALAEAEESLADLAGQVAREQLQADAVRLLHETITRRKREIVQSLVAPVSQRVRQTMRRIVGPRFEDVCIAEDFSMSGVVPRDTEESVAVNQLSGGEQEQLHFAVRLALADIVHRGARQLLVLDDVFTFTDRGRLARIVKLLEEAADRFQVVILTCHPERYRVLPETCFFDLEEILARCREKANAID